MGGGKISLRSDSGFTLAEILVAMAVFGILSGAVLSLFTKNVRTHTAQTLVANAQQDLRAAMMIMKMDIRMAGYDPGKENIAGFINAGAEEFRFTADINGNGKIAALMENGGLETDPNEDVSYLPYETDGIKKVARGLPNPNGTINKSPLIENIEANGLRFAYAVNDGYGRYLRNTNGIVWAVPGANGKWFDLDVNQDGFIDAADDTADGTTDGIIAGRDTGVTVDAEAIRGVQIWMLVRTAAEDPYLPSLNQRFLVGNRILEYDDRFRRRLLTSTVKCRNSAL